VRSEYQSEETPRLERWELRRAGVASARTAATSLPYPSERKRSSGSVLCVKAVDASRMLTCQARWPRLGGSSAGSPSLDKRWVDPCRYRVEWWLPISPRGWGPPSFVRWISVRFACLPDACRIRSMSRIQSRGRIRHAVGHSCCVLNTGGVRRDPVTTWPGRVPNANAGLTRSQPLCAAR
jgi:hypothetical protein